MRTQEMRAIWAEFESATGSLQEATRASLIEERLPELWKLRHDAAEIALTEATKESSLHALRAAMQERQAANAETHTNGLLPNGKWSSWRDSRPAAGGSRTVWAVAAVAAAALAVLWFAFDLPGAKGVKTWIAGGKEPEIRQPGGVGDVPDAPAPEKEEPGGEASPGDTPESAEPMQQAQPKQRSRVGDDGLLAQRVEVGEFTGVMGEPLVTALGERAGKPALPKMTVTTGMRIETGDADKCDLKFKDGSTIALDFNTTVIVPSSSDYREGRTLRPELLRVESGRIVASVVPLSNRVKFVVHTPVATAEVLGTVFSLGLEKVKGSEALKAVLQVREGTVAFYNEHGRVEATSKTETSASAGSAPMEPRQVTRLFRLGPGATAFWYSAVGEDKPSIHVKPEALAIELGVSKMAFVEAKGSLQVVQIQQFSSAERAGLRLGDCILAVNGAAILNGLTFFLDCLKSPKRTLQLTISRDGQQMSVPLTPEPAQPGWLPNPPKPGDPVYEATWLMLKGSLSGAESALKRQLASKSAAAAHNNLGVLYELEDRYRLAIHHFREAVRLAPSVLRYRDNLGRSLYRIGNFLRSFEERSICARLAPENPQILVDLAKSNQALRHGEEALRILDDLLERMPNAAIGWIAKSDLFLEVGPMHESLACAKRAMALAPFDPAVMMRLAFCLQYSGNLVEAEPILRRAIDLVPLNADLYNQLGLLLQFSNRPEEAEKAYRRALELDSAYAFSHLNLGYVLAKARRDEEAVREIRRGIELMPHSWDGYEDHSNAYLNLGSALSRLGRLQEAEASLRKAIALNPLESHAFHLLGSVLARLGRFEESEKEFGRSFELDTTCAHAYTQLFSLYKPLQRFAEAEQAMRKSIALDPKSQLAHHNLAAAIEWQGRREEAEVAWRRAIELDPKNFKAISSLARNLADGGAKLDEALELALRSVTLAPADAAVLANLGWVHFKREEFDRAESVLKESIALFGESRDGAGALCDLGAIYEKLNQIEMAKDAFRRALSLQPDFKKAVEALKRLGGQ